MKALYSVQIPFLNFICNQQMMPVIQMHDITFYLFFYVYILF